MKLLHNAFVRFSSLALLCAFAAVCAPYLPAHALQASTPVGDVRFVYVDEAEIAQGDTQVMAVALEDESLRIVSASATFVRIEDGASVSFDASVCEGNAMLFEFAAEDPGTYALSSIEYAESESSFSLMDFSGEADRPCSFTVAGIDGARADVCERPVSVYSLSDENALDAAADFDGGALADALGANGASTLDAAAGARAHAQSDRIVIALDPGHGGNDPGAVANGLREADITWKIARYCKEYLEKYEGVDVVMTRGRDETLDSLAARVERARAADASVFVSIHINAASPSAHGAEVWYPNDSSWKYEETHQEGGKLAQAVLDELVSLGLSDRGIKIRDWNGASYENGSVADYYGVIRHAREAGIPGIIVEHAFITNADDAAMLADETMLEKMGRADAAGIAEAYGLRTDGAWVLEDGGRRYRVGGSFVTEDWLFVNGSWYWMDSAGYAVTGWQRIGDAWYYFDPDSCIMYSAEWLEQSGSLYHLSYSGAMNVGWFTVDGARYVADGSGALLSGWQCEGGTWHYYEPYAATGWRYLGGNWYWFDKLGVMATGFVSIGSDRYCFDASGAMVVGWILDADGAWHYADGSGRIVAHGWAFIGGAWYYFENGRAATGWVSLSGTWYHLDEESCAMDSGWYRVGDTWYFSDESGAMQTGWLQRGDTWYWLDDSGAMATGWRFIGGDWYWFDGSGAMATRNFVAFDGSAWLADDTGRLVMGVSGWYLLDSIWLYSNGDGSLATGWLLAGGAWYYCAPDGTMQTGWIEKGADRYYLGSSGAMVTGWVVLDGVPCYFDASGRFIEGAHRELEPVMGSPSASKEVLVDAMVAAYGRSEATYPASSLSAGGAPSVRDFCSIVYDQAVSEGVRPEVLFCQAMKETGWLRFGGDVDISQFNFGGLGATGGGVAGERFESVAQGLLAQVQHLKAYGCDLPLRQQCVDTRFSYVKRNTAPYVEWLGIPDNPYGGGWAAAKGYGYDLAAMMDDCFA
ncbi:MAG: N-acetylmuramoyl-L-alanine amidase [Slackia sp.]|nr:N-acetylmuramoyl-L-alanine amidase [Slackia sp.]